ncbi:tyrosine-type recombinase/integrase [Rhizobium herbae]|uniref:Tyrosine-type recombinase/integrase n=1 Tax=Rhizobium herbae TaxID=508661 RepID=A0ABS7H455_9HYPH|nr:tyrosine-type recombinase/integrase [Rhizobium herbae]
MLQKITKRVVDQLMPGETVWDSEVKGFGVRCRASGAKYYGLKTRIGGRQRWITIGRHGSPCTADSARAEALRLLGQKAAGKDPASERDHRKHAVNVTELCERFLEDYVGSRVKEKTAKDYEHLVRKLIIPTLGRHRIADVKRPDVSRFHHDLRDRPYLANRALAVLSKMFNLAEQWGLRDDNTNPCRHVAKFRENKRERYLTDGELKRLGEVLTEAEASNAESPHMIAAIRLLILTGARLSEITTLRWEYVDLEHRLLRLPDSKTGKKDIVLNDAALDVLRRLPRALDNPYAIVGGRSGQHLVNVKGPWGRLRKKAGLDDLRIHDLRHSFASVAASMGESLPIIGKLLGHTQAQTTARYAHLQIDPLRAASNAIGVAVSAAMNPAPESVSRRKKRRVRLNEN